MWDVCGCGNSGVLYECGYGAGGEWVSVCQNGLYTYYVNIARVLSVKKAFLGLCAQFVIVRVVIGRVVIETCDNGCVVVPVEHDNLNGVVVGVEDKGDTLVGKV